MAAEEQDTERTAVKTYVPAYQRDRWDAHADEMGMSRSEFVRTMVQAGRRGIDPRGSAEETGREDSDVTHEPRPLAEDVRSLLEDGPRSWDDLVEALTDDVESRLEETLHELQDADEVRYSGRNGGYVLTS